MRGLKNNCKRPLVHIWWMEQGVRREEHGHVRWRAYENLMLSHQVWGFRLTLKWYLEVERNITGSGCLVIGASSSSSFFPALHLSKCFVGRLSWRERVMLQTRSRYRRLYREKSIVFFISAEEVRWGWVRTFHRFRDCHFPALFSCLIMQMVCLKWQVQGSNGLGFWYYRCSTVVPAMADSVPVSQAIALS
jgi:hypothetical protein